jgi:hypothetical protein
MSTTVAITFPSTDNRTCEECNCYAWGLVTKILSPVEAARYMKKIILLIKLAILCFQLTKNLLKLLLLIKHLLNIFRLSLWSLCNNNFLKN